MKINTYTIKITETKEGNSIKWETETKGRATSTIKAHILEMLLEEMISRKYRMRALFPLRNLIERFGI